MNGALGLQHPKISGPPRPISSVPSARRGGKVAGKAAGLVMPQCNTEAMAAHLAEISRHVACGAHAVLILDQAGWHASAALAVPANITLLPLPPKCPELNPVENVWQFLRDTWLSNTIFTSCDDIVDHCCTAWNKLIEQPQRITTIGLRQWAHGRRSMRVGITCLGSPSI